MGSRSHLRYVGQLSRSSLVVKVINLKVRVFGSRENLLLSLQQVPLPLDHLVGGEHD